MRRYIFLIRGAIVCSANFSTNGLELFNEPANQLEAGVFIGKDEAPYKDVKKWYKSLENKIEDITSEEIKERKSTYKRLPHIGPRKPKGVGPKVLVNKELSISLENANQFFLCNTNRKYGGRTPNGGYTLEEKMHGRGYAAAWEDFRYPKDMEQVEKGDIIYMFAKGIGIIGVGRAKGKCEILKSNNINRVAKSSEIRSTEWRVPVDWLDWRNAKDAYRYKSLNLTFRKITDQDLLGKLKKHFLNNM